MSDRLKVTFQGTKSGLVIAVDDSIPFAQMIRALKKKLTDSGYFFVDASVTLSLNNRLVTQKELQQLKGIIEEQHGLRVDGIKSSKPESLEVAQELKLTAIQSSNGAPEKQKTQPPKPEPSQSTQNISGGLPTEFLRRTVRSGQLHECVGNLVVLGDVNPGAELVAGGDILVFGTLRGQAHAGATGKKDALIVALNLHPTQLRIADRVARANADSRTNHGPECAFIEKDYIVIDKWPNRNHLLTLA